MDDAIRSALERAKAEAAKDPRNAQARFECARLLTLLGEDEAARKGYLELLHLEPTHLGALTNLGALANAGGHRTAARTAYEQAVACHPGSAAAKVNLGNLLREDGDLAAARECYAKALELDSSFAEAHRGLALVCFALGENETAERHMKEGGMGAALAIRPFRGGGGHRNVLLLVSARGGNIPVERFLDDKFCATSALYVEGWREGMALPSHDVVFNSIGDADLCAAPLSAAARILRATKAPVINRPDVVRATSRAHNAERLAGIGGLIVPRTLSLSRENLEQNGAAQNLEAEGLRFPLLLRSPGFHTGLHFVRVERPSGLAGAVQSLPGSELLAISLLDARGDDGLSRKYRVMAIGGRLYPIHMAASENWKVHYFTSAMSRNARLREEEAAFLNAMPGVLGTRAMRALDGIARTLGLDYAGIDFGLARDGDVLFFEANATMVILPPAAEPMWDYRRPAISRALEAARNLVGNARC